ncbi:hypothetical protein GPECTOR_16g742 [Gonium pectorale]|uniref:Uncharacterized protein n=1 Tax=Gonium pectorale TaxID=33097 RepID=A0A150GLA6_GONPE|nr:hypothetical protein GPECTOR_16g742 [Gonium pectorale]|eukprot:KXZ50567.1 hypothetical protein GPECTOR_16g742 [Gonium pectorale]
MIVRFLLTRDDTRYPDHASEHPDRRNAQAWVLFDFSAEASAASSKAEALACLPARLEAAAWGLELCTEELAGVVEGPNSPHQGTQEAGARAAAVLPNDAPPWVPPVIMALLRAAGAGGGGGGGGGGLDGTVLAGAGAALGAFRRTHKARSLK